MLTFLGAFLSSLAYLTNLMSAALLFPVLIMLGEVWQWKALFANENGGLQTFLVGSAVTVRPPSPSHPPSSSQS